MGAYSSKAKILDSAHFYYYPIYTVEEQTQPGKGAGEWVTAFSMMGYSKEKRVGLVHRLPEA